MTGRAFFALVFGGLLVFSARLTGYTPLAVPGLVLLCALALTLLSRLALGLSLRAQQTLSASEVARLENVRLQLHLRVFALLPDPAARLLLLSPDGTQTESTRLLRSFGVNAICFSLPCPHAGQAPLGVTQIELLDCFGFFRTRRTLSPLSLTILPRVLPGEVPQGQGGALRPAAGSDGEPPDGLRDHRAGDPLSRIHWKVSMRRGVLTVRTQETRQSPDLLVLLAGDLRDLPLEQARPIVDRLLENALGFAAAQAARGALRLVLPDGRSLQADLRDLMPLRRLLAHCRFSEGISPLRLLREQQAASHRPDGACILLPRLCEEEADAMLSLLGTGTALRFVLCDAPTPAEEALLARLRAAGASCPVPEEP